MFCKELGRRVLVLDGAMGTMIQRLKLTNDAFGGEKFSMLSDILLYSRPNDIKGIHLEYLQAGANIVETNTFGATSLRLAEFDFTQINLSDFQVVPQEFDISKNDHEQLSYYLSVQGAKVARQAVEEYKKESSYDGRPLFVAGSIGPSNWVITSTNADLKKGNFDQIEQVFYTQCKGLLDGGVDIFLIETQQDPLELKAAVLGARRAMDDTKKSAAIMAQVSVDKFGRMPIFNTDMQAIYVTIKDLGIDAFGFNCNLAPAEMEPNVKRVCEFSEHPVSIVPNAGQPENIDGEICYRLEPEVMADFAYKFASEHGANIVGGCCGSTPDHIKAIADRVRDLAPKERNIEKKLYISGPQEAICLDSEKGLVKIGERLNVRGSKKVRLAVETSENIDFESLESVVEEQVKDLGLTTIDICMDSNVVKTEELLPKAIYNLTSDFKGAMCIDSFSVEALEAGIKSYPGRPIINSISLEEYSKGKTKLDAVLEITAKHQPLYIALAADSSGPATTAEGKVEIAKKIIEGAKKHGIGPGNLFIDINAFPVGSESVEGQNFALESLKSIPMIKALHKDLRTSIGVGNLTSGLGRKPYMRLLLTSVFLDEARKNGFDAAIINPNHYAPVEGLNQDDVALARKAILDHDMDAFAELEEIAVVKSGKRAKTKGKDYDGFSAPEKVCQLLKDGKKQKTSGEVTIDGKSYSYSDKIVLDVAKSIETVDPLDFISGHLMKAIRELGDLFGNGEVSLPHLLKSTDIMKHAMKFLESYINDKKGNTEESDPAVKTIVLGTVYQDVHSIGKDLVKTLYENYGYNVVDLGVQVDSETFVKEVKKHNAIAIGMSALLVQTSTHMITVSQMLKDEGIEIPILIGGAAVNSRHASFAAMAGEDDIEKINPLVFYCKSAMDGVNILDRLVGRDRDALIAENRNILKKYHSRGSGTKKVDKNLPQRVVKSPNFGFNDSIFGAFDLNVTMDALAPVIDSKNLYSINWKFGAPSKWVDKGVNLEKLEKLKEKWVGDSIKNSWIEPISRYGLFPAKADGLELIIYDPRHLDNEIGRFSFDEISSNGERWSFPMYFRHMDDPGFDLVGLSLVSAGKKPGEEALKFQKEDDMESYFMLRGLADRVAEDTAEFTHNHIRGQLNFPENSGGRVSPGYSLIKDLKNNKLIFDLLKTDNLDIDITGANEFSPTCTTGAIICFNSDFKF